MDGAVLDPAGVVPLRRHGVRVPGEEHERPAGALRVQQRLAVVEDALERDVRGHVRVQLGLLARRRGDVDELERPLREDRGSGVSGHNRPMIPRSPEPERGFVLAVLAQGADADEELAEVEELARTAGVEPVGRAVPAPAEPGAAHVRRQGEARGAEGALRGDRGREPARRRRARPGAAAVPRGRARRARHRPDAAHPRHLRPARRHRRGEAPGRAGAARVQPPADARPLAAPRAPRRRRRDARPRRDAARERPPPGAPPDRAPRAAAEARRAPARDAPQPAAAERDADRRARRVHERRQVDAAERAHRRRGLRRQPPVRDARPDHARLRARGATVPRDRHRRVHPPSAASARRGVRLHARGDARRRPRAPRRRRVGERGAPRRDGRRSRRRAVRDRRRRAAASCSS